MPGASIDVKLCNIASEVGVGAPLNDKSHAFENPTCCGRCQAFRSSLEAPKIAKRPRCADRDHEIIKLSGVLQHVSDRVAFVVVAGRSSMDYSVANAFRYDNELARRFGNALAVDDFDFFSKIVSRHAMCGDCAPCDGGVTAVELRHAAVNRHSLRGLHLSEDTG